MSSQTDKSLWLSLVTTVILPKPRNGRCLASVKFLMVEEAQWCVIKLYTLFSEKTQKVIQERCTVVWPPWQVFLYWFPCRTKEEKGRLTEKMYERLLMFIAALFMVGVICVWAGVRGRRMMYGGQGLAYILLRRSLLHVCDGPVTSNPHVSRDEHRSW